MNNLKSTLESFKENELLRTHKLKINGGLPVNGLPLEELPLDEEGNGDPVDNGTGPIGGGGPSSGASAATLGNSNTSGTTTIVPGGK